MEERKSIVKNYVKSYNDLDVVGMLKDMSEEVEFVNTSEGEVNLSIKGKEAFRKQAQSALTYFSTRHQTIQDWEFDKNQITISVSFKAVLATDFPNGMKAGDTLEVEGKSIFLFDRDKIIKLIDES